jgi:hypothetical protein
MWDSQAPHGGEGVAEPRRISQTVIKPLAPSHEEPLNQGFRAELPGWDLATLLQMACARGGRSCVEIRSGSQIGYVFLGDGRLIHAAVGIQIGEPAVATMLGWTGGAFALCDRPWPLKPSMDEAIDVVLLRVAQARDEAQRHSGRTTPFVRSSQSPPGPSLRLSPAASPAPGLEERTQRDAESGVLADRSAKRADAEEGPVLASVRVDMNGEIVARNGAADALAPLIGYITRMGALLGVQLGLDPFEALAADLGTKRALVYVEGNEMVGLLLGPGALYQELRQQLGV